MNSPHTPAPEIPGFTLLRHLGSGGYSDVFLYEQASPRMQVAVKVLPSGQLDKAERDQFEAEAQTMAQLSGHPHIVQVFTTGLTADGRPYLVMTYYPPPNLAERVAANRLPIGDVLRIAIQISSAVQLAHESGILHRDIKPANILISQYGEPGLADFGIAGRGDAENAEDLGVSTPWCAPEVLAGGSNGTAQSDVYSLAATVWNLLVGRSPFEIGGGDNSQKALTARVLRGGAPATGRADVPASLERLLAQSMAKNPRLRPRTALDFAHSLQGIEQELRLPRTKIPGIGSAITGPEKEPFDFAGADTAVVEDTSVFKPKTGPDRTMQRPAVVPSPAEPLRTFGPPRTFEPPQTFEPPRTAEPTVNRPPVVPPPVEFAPAAQAETVLPEASPVESAATIRRPAVVPAPAATPSRERVMPGDDLRDATIRRPATPTEPAPVPPTKPGMNKGLLIGAAVVVLAAVVGVGIWLTSGSSKKSETSKDAPPPAIATDQTQGLGLPPAAPKVKGTWNASAKAVTFTWTATGTGLSYGWYPGTDSAKLQRVSKPTVVVKGADPKSTCISVVAIPFDGGPSSEPSELTCG